MVINGSALALRRLVKHFGELRVLDHVEAEIEAGSFTAILGPSGSGKSTLLMTIAGFEAPESGSVLIDGVDVTAIPPERRGIGVVFQGYALFPHMTVADNIAYALRARGWGRAKTADRVQEMAALMEIGELLGRYPAQLSGGQRQRVAIARALAFEPRLLLLDEPLSALDRGLRDRMKAELQRLHRRLGVTIVMVTHDQDEASALADTVIVMESGAIIARGAPRRLYEQPDDIRVAAFFGRASFLRAAPRGEGRIEAGGASIDTANVGGEGDMLLVRPEGFRLAGNGEGIRVEVASAVFHAGRISIAGTAATGEAVIAELPDEIAGGISAGDVIVLGVARASLIRSRPG